VTRPRNRAITAASWTNLSFQAADSSFRVGREAVGEMYGGTDIVSTLISTNSMVVCEQWSGRPEEAANPGYDHV
jgi:hypothetical protein